MRAVLVLLLLSGCAIETKINGPDGKTAHLIECDGAAVPMSVCYKKAAQVCPDGYYLAEQGSGAGGAAGFGAAILSSSATKNIVVVCKNEA